VKTDFDLQGFLYDPNPPSPDLKWLYGFMVGAILVIIIVSTLAVYIHRINSRLHREAAEHKQTQEFLQKAFDDIRTLRGILPLCASCKIIRDDHGFWEQVEVYVRDHTEAEFSHGISPECAKLLYPEYINQEDDKP
jgi:hypothetical protein